MDRSEVTPTLLNAILSNQVAMTKAILEIAEWADSEGSVPVANAVRKHVEAVNANRVIIGSCISALMQAD